MTQREFIITEEDYNKKKKTIIQHKIRTLLKCYTVQDFNLSEESNSFTFRQTHKINGIQIVSKKTITGKYEIIKIESDNKQNLKLIISV